MATGIYDPEEEALLRRAHEYATGQVPYDNEEDLLNQAQSYSQNPRYWNQAGAAPMAYDPTLEPADAYPGAVPQNDFMQPSPYQIPEQPASYEEGAGYDQPTPEEGMGYPQPEPNAPQAEFAVNRPGFIYKGPVAGEAAARYAWNEAGPAEPEIPDRTGNYIAQQRALEFDRRKAQAEAQREIEFAYQDAKTAGQMAAFKASQQHLQDRMIAEALANGMPHDEILLRYGTGGNSPTASASMYRAMHQNPTPTLTTLPTGQQVYGNNKTFKFVPPQPITFQTPEGEIKGQAVINPNTGEVDPDRYIISNPRTGRQELVDTRDKNTRTRLKLNLPGENPLSPSGTLEGTPESVAAIAGTNFPNLNLPGRNQTGTIKIVPPAAAIARLKKEPSLRKDFDAKYGSGAAAAILGK